MPFQGLPFKAGANPQQAWAGMLQGWTKVRTLLWDQAQPQEALKQAESVYQTQQAQANPRLLPPWWPRFQETSGFAALHARQFPAAYQLFFQANNLYMAGYTALMAQAWPEAQQCWLQLAKTQPNHWGVSLWSLLQGQQQITPTFLQIRNHVEMDVHYLLTYGHVGLAEQLLAASDTLAQFNPEVYKLLGRMLLFHGRYPQAYAQLDKALQVLPNDPELYFTLGEGYAREKRWEESHLMLTQCLAMVPSLVPAQRLSQEVLAVLNKLASPENGELL
jgi:tetratricopeptide (TPR) repeat protein